MYNTNLKISRAFAFGQEHQEMQEHRSKHQQMLTQFKDLKGICSLARARARKIARAPSPLPPISLVRAFSL
jgi:hypothetical protein